MIIVFKAIGATVVAGALAASGLVTSDHFLADSDGRPDAVATEVTDDSGAIVDDGTTTTTEESTTTTTEPPTTTTTEAPTTTTTTAPPPPPVTLPPPVEPTVIPVAGAGSVVIVLEGPVIVVQKIKLVPGWIADVERRSGDVNVVFRNGGRSFRFLAAMKDRRLFSDIWELRADGDRRIGFSDRGDDDRWKDGRRDNDRNRDGGWKDGGRDGARDGRRHRH